MITVCGDYGDKYWVSDLMLTCFGKLCEILGRNDMAVEYADSMDNAQMKDPMSGVETEAEVAKNRQVDFLFVLYRDDMRKNKLFYVFRHLSNILPPHIFLIFVATFAPDEALTEEEKDSLRQRYHCAVISERDIRTGNIPFLST